MLFKAAGHEQAPETLRSAVMEQVLAQQAPVSAQPLISAWQWALAAVALGVPILIAWLATHMGTGPSADTALPFLPALAAKWNLVLHYPWLPAVAVLALVLALADRIPFQAHARHAH